MKVLVEGETVIEILELTEHVITLSVTFKIEGIEVDCHMKKIHTVRGGDTITLSGVGVPIEVHPQ